MSTAFDFGVQKPCTPQQLVQEVKDLYSKCDIWDMGTFYFVYGKETGVKGRYEVMVKFYDKTNQVLHSSSCEIFVDIRTTLQQKTVALDHCTFFMKPGNEGCVVVVMTGALQSSSSQRMAEGI